MIDQSLLDELGIVDWGYTEESLPRSYTHYDEWVKAGKEGPLGYLSDHRKEIRTDLRKLYPEFQSALVFLFSYRPTKKWLLDNQRFEIAAYALGFGGEDYHHVLKRSLLKILGELQKDHSVMEGFVTLDAQPVLERDLAYRAGLGWFGKNSMLIHRGEGSYFIIGSLLLNQKLALTQKLSDTDHCGQCNACVEACPTLAIDGEARTIVADKCISTYTIEIMKEAPPPDGMENSRGEVFGCDICQDVCPWNKKPLERTQSRLNLSHSPSVENFFQMKPSELLSFLESNSGRAVQRYLEGSALARPGKKGWIKNIKNLARRA